MFEPRPGQREVLEYSTGLMGIAAVPGSGKTHTLSRLAAQLVAGSSLKDDQEVLIVTLVNSAVQNFSSRIAIFLNEMGLLPNMGYRVRTLHGLAHDIVRGRPDLVGLSDQFSIIEERESESILQAVVASHLSSRNDLLKLYIKDDADLEKYDVRKRWVESIRQLCANSIRVAKDLQKSPLEIKDALDAADLSDPLLDLVVDVYSDYQRSLSLRSAVDFDDLISLALKAVTLDGGYLARLQNQWPYILEDEAQDSSRLQEEILKFLCGPNGNWVRVGDPNQAIFETFTTASPVYLRRFLDSPGVRRCNLSESGRSTRSIIALANDLIRWAKTAEETKLRSSLDEPFILPVSPRDPQPNPPDDPSGIHLSGKSFTPEDELNFIARSIKNWLPSHSQETCAVLVPRNDRGTELAEKLRMENIPVMEILRSSSHTRKLADALASVLIFLTEPNHPGKLAAVFEKILEVHAEQTGAKTGGNPIPGLLRKCSQCEDFLSPRVDRDWLASLDLSEDLARELSDFRTRIQRWKRAILLPIDQLILIIGQDLFTSPPDLALTHKLALSLERTSSQEPGLVLPDFAQEMTRIASNQRKFIGFEDEDTGFEPDKHKGRVLVSTIHKAKGLEWDRVYLASVNNYDFPFAQVYDQFISEKWFIRDHLNLEAETIAKLTALVKKDLAGQYAEEGDASRQSRLEYSSERLRLFFVGITRARKNLCITWNTGRRGDARQSVPYEAIRSFWEGKNAPSN